MLSVAWSRQDPAQAVEVSGSQAPADSIPTLFANLNEDAAAPARLERALLALDRSISAGGKPEAELIRTAVIAATYLPYYPVGPPGRTSSDEEVLDLGDRLASAYPDAQQSSELLAIVAVERANRLLASAGPEAVLTCLRPVLQLEPKPVGAAPALLAAIGDAERLLGQWDQAQETLQEVLKGQDMESAARASLSLARLESELGRLELARLHLVRAKELDAASRGANSIAVELETTFHQITTERFSNAVRSAEGLLERGDLERDDWCRAKWSAGYANWLAVRQKGGLEETATESLELALSEGLQPPGRHYCRLHLTDMLLELGEIDRAQEQVELVEEEYPAGSDHLLDSMLAAAKGRALRMAGAPVAERQAQHEVLVAAQANLLADWDGLLAHAGGVGFLQFGERNAPLGECIASELDLDSGLEGVERALGHAIAAQHRGSLAHQLALTQPSLAGVRESLAPGQLLLVYAFATHASFVFAVDRESIDVYPLKSRWELRAQADEFGATFSQSPRSLPAGLRDRMAKQARDLSLELRKVLLPEVLLKRVLAAPHVSLAGEQHLGAFPFEALELDDGRFMGHVVALDHWSSVTLGSALVTRAKKGNRKVAEGAAAFLAPSADDAGMGPLVLNEEQRTAWTQAWPELDLRAGEDASESALASMNFGSIGTLAFVTHGIWEQERLRPSGMLLAPTGTTAGLDGRLWAEDIEGLLAPPLVLMGVCRAASGQKRRGDDGAGHLGGAWIAAGANCVVLSPFALEEESTHAWLSAFGSALSSGESPAAAARLARVRVAEQWPEPFYHSLLRVLGDGFTK